MTRAIVVGGGVAGSATALFLKSSGWDVEIYEAQSEPEPYSGLFLNVATNGLAVFEALGLRERLLSDAHPAPHMQMWSRTGKRLGTVPNGPAGDPARGSVIVRRDWLNTVARNGAEAAGIPMIWGAKLVSIDESSGGVHATFADGRVVAGDILIGCDGIGSPTRHYIDPAAPEPVFSGLIGLGGFARVDGLEPTRDTQHFVFGARSFFGYLVREDGTVYWFANVTSTDDNRSALRAISGADWLARLRTLHADDPYPVPEILQNSSLDLSGYPIYDLPHVPKWSRGNVVAVGDAVHATSPSAGQGASLALEDAMTLASLLRSERNQTDAFAAYQRMRQPRVEAIVEYARAINKQKRVTKGRLGVAIRDAVMPMFLRRAADDQRNDWLYNHVIEWERTEDSGTGQGT